MKKICTHMGSGCFNDQCPKCPHVRSTPESACSVSKCHNDDTFSDLADSVAAKIVYDFTGLTVNHPQSLVLTGQLEGRIARALRAFHHNEGHLEDLMPHEEPCHHHWVDAQESVFDFNRYCIKCGRGE